MPTKIEKIFLVSDIIGSEDVAIICCYNLCLLRKEYLSAAVNGVSRSPQILYTTKRDFFQLNCIRSDQ